MYASMSNVILEQYMYSLASQTQPTPCSADRIQSSEYSFPVSDTESDPRWGSRVVWLARLYMEQPGAAAISNAMPEFMNGRKELIPAVLQ